jgi:hypothetical protein
MKFQIKFFIENYVVVFFLLGMTSLRILFFLEKIFPTIFLSLRDVRPINNYHISG